MAHRVWTAVILGFTFVIGLTADARAANGTADAPIFIRGASPTMKPVLRNSVLMVRAHHVILEFLDFDRNQQQSGAVDIRPWWAHESVHHVAVRYSEARNLFSGPAGNTAMFSAGNYAAGNDVSDVVFLGNHIHPDDNAFPADAYEKDTAGVGIVPYSTRVWIVDNDIHWAAGDAVGGGHAANYTASYYYIGRNSLHDCGENAVDVKEVDHLIVSQNQMFDFTGRSAGSDGTALVVHYGPTLSTRNAWILFNEISHATDAGIQIGGSQLHPVYVLGNIIHDVHNDTGTGKAIVSWGSRDIHLSGNTIVNVDNGIVITGDGAEGSLVAVNNVIAYIGSSGVAMSLADSTYRAVAVIKANLFYQPRGRARIFWGAVLDVGTWHGETGQCAGCLEAYPRFGGSSRRDYRVRVGSPAIDAGVADGCAALFAATYGLRVDRTTTVDHARSTAIGTATRLPTSERSSSAR